MAEWKGTHITINGSKQEYVYGYDKESQEHIIHIISKKKIAHVAYWAFELTLISRVWLTYAGRFTPLIGVGATKMGK